MLQSVLWSEGEAEYQEAYMPVLAEFAAASVRLGVLDSECGEQRTNLLTG